MKKAFLFLICVALAVSNTGCASSPNRTAEGAVIGGAVGAGAGAIIGHQSGETGEGAALGGLVGALAGSLVGSQVQKQPAAVSQANPPGQVSAANPNQMSIQQIVDLSKQGVHEDVIVDKIRLTNSRFTLSADDLNYLKNQGVSQKVINSMLGL
jgi:uncharacterized protein YcfJ